MKRPHRHATALSLGALCTALFVTTTDIASAQTDEPPASEPPSEPTDRPEEGEAEAEESKEEADSKGLTEEERAAAEARKRAALKEEIKAELRAELEAEREAAAREAEEKRRREAEARPSPPPSGEGPSVERKGHAGVDTEKQAKEDERNPLVPDWQDEALGNHAVAAEESTYKPGSGLHFESEDGAFALTTRLRAQMRQTIRNRTSGGESELSQIFQIRRARLQFKGHAFNEHNKMKVEFAFSPRDLGMRDGVPHNTPLLTWYFEFDYLRDLTVRMGQYKIPYSRQRVASSGDLQLVDRSIANGEFNEDRDIGFDLRSKDLFGLGGYLRYYAGVYMGEGRDFGDRNATPDFKLHYLGRLEVLPMGDFEDYAEADIERNLTPKLSLGGAYSFHHDAQRLRGVLGDNPTDGGTTDYHSFNVDYMFKWVGLSSTGEFHWRKGDREAGDATIADPADPTLMIPAPVEAARNGYGWHVQAGYLFPTTALEIAARYSGVRGFGEEDPGNLILGTNGFTSLGQRDAVGGGVSYYFAGHPWKLQGDYFHVWNDGDHGEADDRVRVQLQLAY